MSDFDDDRYIVVERGSGGFGNFLWGLLIGAGAALLMAPKNGRETREELRQRWDRVREGAEGRFRDVQDALEDTVGDVRRQMNDGLDRARHAMESGREAARTSRAEMEGRLRESAAAFQGGWNAARGAVRPTGAEEAADASVEDVEEPTES
ncbi:MAG TPA: YtxH domain-containing protein [Longimicrobiales bacterium]|nr:YtxH domain-containing protein [Longimicrobiales bacterium]